MVLSGSPPRAEPRPHVSRQRATLSGISARLHRRQQKAELRKSSALPCGPRLGRHAVCAAVCWKLLVCPGSIISEQLTNGWNCSYDYAAMSMILDINQNRKAHPVFSSWLDKMGLHPRADYGTAGCAFVFHQSCRPSIYRRHGDVLQWALVDPSGIGSSKLSHQGSNAGILVISRASPGFWWSRARTRARMECINS